MTVTAGVTRFGLFVFGSIVLLGCDGGGASSDKDCGTMPVDFDASSALGFPPTALWDAYVGHYESLAEWRALTAEGVATRGDGDRVRVTIDVTRDEDRHLYPVACSDPLTANDVHAPVVVRIDASDDSVSGTHRVWLEGVFPRTMINFTAETRGAIYFDDGLMSFSLWPSDVESRVLWSITSERKP